MRKPRPIDDLNEDRLREALRLAGDARGLRAMVAHVVSERDKLLARSPTPPGFTAERHRAFIERHVTAGAVAIIRLSAVAVLVDADADAER